MTRTSRWLLAATGASGVFAVLLAYAWTGKTAPSSAEAASAPSKSVAGATTEEQFQSPEEIAKKFRAELERLAERKGLVSPLELVRQAEAQKTTTLETLPDPGQKLAPEAIYAKTRPGVVIIGGITKGKKRRDGQLLFGTGFVIRKDGMIVTNCHVVIGFQDMKTVGVMTDDGRMFPITAVLAADSRNDVAILKVEADNLTPLPVAASAPVGARIYCISHPALNTPETETGFYTFTEGVVSAKFRLRLHGYPALNVLTITADYAKGSSGAPILNEHGAVVGIVCETLPLYGDAQEQDVQMVWKFSRPSSSILALLREKPPAPKP
jgi:S1-C subfamily serine protease